VSDCLKMTHCNFLSIPLVELMNCRSLGGLSGGIKYDNESMRNKAAFVSRMLMKRLLCCRPVSRMHVPGNGRCARRAPPIQSNGADRSGWPLIWLLNDANQPSLQLIRRAFAGKGSLDVIKKMKRRKR